MLKPEVKKGAKTEKKKCRHAGGGQMRTCHIYYMCMYIYIVCCIGAVDQNCETSCTQYNTYYIDDKENNFRNVVSAFHISARQRKLYMKYIHTRKYINTNNVWHKCLHNKFNIIYYDIIL